VARDQFYWDANAFVGFLNGEADKVSLCEPVLKQAQNGHILIVTSALTIAEVLFIKGGKKLDPSKRGKIEKFFRADYISVKNVTRAISELARDVFWDFNIDPKDAVHVATAVMFKVPILHTFDVPLLGKNGLVINGHSLKVEKPKIPHQLELLDKSGEAKEN